MRADLVRRAMPLALLAVGGCSWFTDFKEQPRVEPWEAEWTARDSAGKRVMSARIPFPGNPPFSVPVTGTAVAGYQVSYQPMPATIDSMASLVNPTPVSPASLENGRKYFQINCAVCHGHAGAGNGPATRFGMPGIAINGSGTAARTDGYIFGMIRNGRGLMPTYDRIEEADRWDVVNYLRALQGRTGTAADTSAPGWPGQNGRFVPGPSQMGPTRPSPYYSQRRGVVDQQAGAEIRPPGAGDARPGSDSARRVPPPSDTTSDTARRAVPPTGARP